MGSSPHWRLALAWIAGFRLIDSSIVTLALPDIACDFDRPIGQLAWVPTDYLLALPRRADGGRSTGHLDSPTLTGE